MMALSEIERVALGLGAVALLFFGRRLGALGGAGREWRRGRSFAVRAGLPPEAVDAALVRRVIRRQRFVLAGLLLGLTAVRWGDLSLLWIGLAAGAVADQLAVPPAAAGTPRVAHGTRARIGDYVPGWLLVLVGAAAALPGLFALVVVLEPGPPSNLVLTGSPVVLLIRVELPIAAVLAGSLVLARVLVRRQQVVRSPQELAVDDAFRAQAVRDTLQLTAAVSVYRVCVMADGAHEFARGLPQRLGGVVPPVLLLLVATVAVGYELAGASRRWQTLHRGPA